jgi:hypothetical protein
MQRSRNVLSVGVIMVVVVCISRCVWGGVVSELPDRS